VTTKNHQHLVKDDFRHVQLHNGESLTLCTDCLHQVQKGVLLAIIASDYEEVQCDHCSFMNATAAYVDEIEIAITHEKKCKLERTVSRQGRQK